VGKMKFTRNRIMNRDLGGPPLKFLCENFEIKNVKWCHLTLFETMIWMLELLRKN